MFTERPPVSPRLTPYQREHAYHLLYYQFLKHAFGLRWANPSGMPVRLRIYLDKLPDKQERNALFKRHVAGLSRSWEFKQARLTVAADQIAEVRSHDHLVLQCLDVVLGAMQSCLNQPRTPSQAPSERGNKTLAKEALCRLICTRIGEMHPDFVIGATTGTPGGPADRWRHAYRHWLFIPRSASAPRLPGGTEQKATPLPLRLERGYPG